MPSLVVVICAASLGLTVWMAATSGTRGLYLPGPAPDTGAAVSR
jgi:hypothetical protein